MKVKAYQIRKGDVIKGMEVEDAKNSGGTVKVIFVSGLVLYYEFNEDVELEGN